MVRQSKNKNATHAIRCTILSIVNELLGFDKDYLARLVFKDYDPTDNNEALLVRADWTAINFVDTLGLDDQDKNLIFNSCSKSFSIVIRSEEAKKVRTFSNLERLILSKTG